MKNLIIIIAILVLALVITMARMNKAIKERDLIFLETLKLGSALEYKTGKEVNVWESVMKSSKPYWKRRLEQHWLWIVRLAVTPVEQIWKR